jgi:hypothetical protein
MRKLRRNRWALATMAVLLMLATSGLTVSRMSCLISGHSELSLGIVDDCCPEEEHESASVEASCCDLEKAGAQRFDLLSSTELVLIALTAVEIVSSPSLCHAERISPRWLDSRPPPLSGPERLTLVRRFLI